MRRVRVNSKICGDCFDIGVAKGSKPSEYDEGSDPTVYMEDTGWNSSNWTPAEARKIADALRTAADEVEALLAKKRSES